MTTSENVHAALAHLAEPLREQLAELEAEIPTVQIRLKELHQLRRDVTKALMLIDPSSVKAMEKTTPRAKRPSEKVGEETVNLIRLFVTDHAFSLNENTGFSAMVLRKRPDWDFDYRQQTVVEALKRLHEEGVIRLDHTGVAGSRFYKVVV